MIKDAEHATFFVQLVILKGHAERSPTFNFHNRVHPTSRRESLQLIPPKTQLYVDTIRRIQRIAPVPTANLR